MEDKKRKRVRANGQGTVFKMPNGKWRAEVTLGWEKREGKPDKRIVATKSGFKKKGDAVAYLDTLKKERPDIDLGIKFKELYELWSGSHYQRIGKSTENGYRNAFKYCSDLHYRVFTKLKTADLQEVVDACPHGRRTKADMKSLMVNLYKYGIENDYTDKNYASFVKLPPKEKGKKDAFTKAERDLLWADYNAGNEFTGQILFLIYAGLRFGEFKILTKDDFNLKERYFIGGIKTEAGIGRTIPIADCIMPIVQQLLNNTDKKLLTMHEKAWYHMYRATLSRLKIRPLNAHCCRHTSATALAEAGVAPAVITAILGHEDYATTLGYTHISIEEKIAGANKQYVPSSSRK